MTSLLHDAEQQGILDVHLALVTYMDQAAARLDDGKQKLKEDHADIRVGHWRRLDGSDRGLQQDNMDLWNADRILQVTSTAVQESLGVFPDPQATL